MAMNRKSGTATPARPPQPVRASHRESERRDHRGGASQAKQTIAPDAPHRPGVQEVGRHDADDARSEEQTIELRRDVEVGDINGRRAGDIGEGAGVEEASRACVGQEPAVLQ